MSTDRKEGELGKYKNTQDVSKETRRRTDGHAHNIEILRWAGECANTPEKPRWAGHTYTENLDGEKDHTSREIHVDRWTHV